MEVLYILSYAIDYIFTGLIVMFYGLKRKRSNQTYDLHKEDVDYLIMLFWPIALILLMLIYLKDCKISKLENYIIKKINEPYDPNYKHKQFNKKLNRIVK